MKIFTKESLEELQDNVFFDEILSENLDPSDIIILESNYGHSAWLCKCPFCECPDKSFISVYPFGHYFCFECKAHGDAVSFLMCIKKWTFEKSAEYLAKKFKIKLEEVDKSQKCDKNDPKVIERTARMHDLLKRFQNNEVNDLTKEICDILEEDDE